MLGKGRGEGEWRVGEGGVWGQRGGDLKGKEEEEVNPLLASLARGAGGARGARGARGAGGGGFLQVLGLSPLLAVGSEVEVLSVSASEDGGICTCVRVYVYAHIYLCVCVHVYNTERERERERAT